MSGPDISIGVGDSLPYLEDLFLRIIGKDNATKEAADWFRNLQKVALIQASQVQCIGMHHPVPLKSIYQSTQLSVTDEPAKNKGWLPFQGRASRSIIQANFTKGRAIDVDAFLQRRKNAIIFAGPGWGKTTFLHHVFLKHVEGKSILPILISLRRPTALDDLDRFVALAKSITKSEKKSSVLLLVDGYDEISIDDRKRVSEAILRYQALDLGAFYVTCREFYPVLELKAPEVRIGGFTLEDQYRYVRTFLGAFESNLDAVAVVNDFHARGFEDFVSHPLLLALACIVETSAKRIEGRSIIGLLHRAIDVLTYRWDEAKGINRETRTRVDGRGRIQILKRIAFSVKSRTVPDSRALSIASQQLDLSETEDIDPKDVLMETARFFGIFVPSEEGWEFVHRTLHDFLAAQFWVETGEFANSIAYAWDARTAYAACLTQDATTVMQKALATTRGVETFMEILTNAPKFNHHKIADAVIEHYSTFERDHFQEKSNVSLTVNLRRDFIRVASSKFLSLLTDRCLVIHNRTADTIAAYCIVELSRRGAKLTPSTYRKALNIYGSGVFTFWVRGPNYNARLESVDPDR